MRRNLVGRFEKKYHKFLSFDMVTQNLTTRTLQFRSLFTELKIKLKIARNFIRLSISVKKEKKEKKNLESLLYLNFIRASERRKEEKWTLELDSIFYLLENRG